MPLLRRPHDHRRDLRARRPTPPRPYPRPAADAGPRGTYSRRAPPNPPYTAHAPPSAGGVLPGRGVGRLGGLGGAAAPVGAGLAGAGGGSMIAAGSLSPWRPWTGR